jgi:NAD(P)-dependent dehydrogenase (short-subunit alcohol dehydrogenase family)
VVEAAFAAVDAQFGRVDILLGGPAGNRRGHPETMPLEDWQHCLDFGVTVNFLCGQAAGRRMIDQGKGGAIIHLSSIAGATAFGRGTLAYSASKGAINQLTKELAIEWARYRIRVNAILPCQVRTPSLQRFIDDKTYLAQQLVTDFMRGLPLGRPAEAEEIAAAAVFLASDAASMITGVLLPVDGGNLAMNAGATLQW